MTNLVKISQSSKLRTKKQTRNTLNKREFMLRSHALAKTLEGHYQARMSIAMKLVYSFENQQVPDLQYKRHKNAEGIVVCDSISYVKDGYKCHYKLAEYLPLRTEVTGQPRSSTLNIPAIAYANRKEIIKSLKLAIKLNRKADIDDAIKAERHQMFQDRLDKAKAYVPQHKADRKTRLQQLTDKLLGAVWNSLDVDPDHLERELFNELIDAQTSKELHNALASTIQL